MSLVANFHTGLGWDLSNIQAMFSDRKASFKTPPQAVKETLTSQEARRNRVRIAVSMMMRSSD